MMADFEEGKIEDFPVFVAYANVGMVPYDPKGSGIRNLESLFSAESKLV